MMEISYERFDCGDNVENEYHLEVSVESIDLEDKDYDNISVAVVFGNLMNELKMKDVDESTLNLKKDSGFSEASNKEPQNLGKDSSIQEVIEFFGEDLNKKFENLFESHFDPKSVTKEILKRSIDKTEAPPIIEEVVESLISIISKEIDIRNLEASKNEPKTSEAPSIENIRNDTMDAISECLSVISKLSSPEKSTESVAQEPSVAEIILNITEQINRSRESSVDSATVKSRESMEETTTEDFRKSSEIVADQIVKILVNSLSGFAAEEKEIETSVSNMSGESKELMEESKESIGETTKQPETTREEIRKSSEMVAQTIMSVLMNSFPELEEEKEVETSVADMSSRIFNISDTLKNIQNGILRISRISNSAGSQNSEITGESSKVALNIIETLMELVETQKILEERTLQVLGTSQEEFRGEKSSEDLTEANPEILMEEKIDEPEDKASEPESNHISLKASLEILTKRSQEEKSAEALKEKSAEALKAKSAEALEEKSAEALKEKSAEALEGKSAEGKIDESKETPKQQSFEEFVKDIVEELRKSSEKIEGSDGELNPTSEKKVKERSDAVLKEKSHGNLQEEPLDQLFGGFVKELRKSFEGIKESLLDLKDESHLELKNKFGTNCDQNLAEIPKNLVLKSTKNQLGKSREKIPGSNVKCHAKQLREPADFLKLTHFSKKMSPKFPQILSSTATFMTHAVPQAMAKKMKNDKLKFIIKRKLQKLGAFTLNLNDCFPNAIQCRDFQSAKLTKVCEFQLSNKNHCKITFNIKISKDYENSIKYRSFYTQCTKEKQKLLASPSGQTNRN